MKLFPAFICQRMRNIKTIIVDVDTSEFFPQKKKKKLLFSFLPLNDFLGIDLLGLIGIEN